LKFVKYLPEFGWTPHVYTPENPSFEIRDDALLRDIPKQAVIIKKPIWEPYHLFKSISKLTGKKPIKQIDMVSAGKKSLFQKLTSWIRGNVFVPDPRVMWVEPSIKFLKKYIRANDIRTVITTGPPHSLHLIGMKLKKKFPDIKWVADFRDPWSEWDLLDTLSLSSFARKQHKKLERKVLTRADKVLTIAPLHVGRLEALGGRRVELVTNGFDEDDFKVIVKKKTERFTIRHIGQVDELRDPRPFMNAVLALGAELPEMGDQIRIEFVGPVNTGFRNFVQQDDLLSKVTSFVEPLRHDDLLQLYGSTDVQLLILAHTALAAGNLPGKLFEYLASGNFIFGIGPTDGDAAAILKQTHAGVMIARGDGPGITVALRERFNAWKAGIAESGRDVSAFSRKVLTQRLDSIIR
ncbi:MAG TPA: hypothetical protein VG737_07370, partial [Cyclobacteriaceae bacterium]|nr:hypothetical protein [Cyclobacteriaceae bacterium]